ncbi:MAG: hypothetical protein HPY80_10425 [Bacteroidales bacterium]|jgi:hypothetical protein|nr:hypothetical protein [Bacteroidales bacterium]NPV37069.1 hypothetical protein [Bacteroidales bacterium]
MKTTTITLTEIELNDLREFYTTQLARARREVAHYENILSKLEKGEKPSDKGSVTEAPVAKVKGKRGRPRKERPVVDMPVDVVAEPSAIAEAQPKAKKGRPRKVKETPEPVAVEEKPKGRQGKKALAAETLAENVTLIEEKPKGKRGRPTKNPEEKVLKSKAKGPKNKGAKTNTRGRKTVTPELDIPYTDFILAKLANATQAMGAKDLITLMRDEYKLEDKGLLKKAEASLRSSLSGLKKKSKISWFKSDAGIDKYYLAQPMNNETEAQPTAENPGVEE